MENDGRVPKGGEGGASGGEAVPPSPGRVILVGLLAGAVASILLTGVVLLAEEGRERAMVLLYALLPVLGAGVSGGAAALAKGRSPGRALGVALLAVLGTVFLAGPLEYGLLASRVAPPFEPAPPGGEGGFPAAGLAAPAALAIAAGTLLGLMLGRGAARRRRG